MFKPSLTTLCELLAQPTQPKVQAFIKTYLAALNRPWTQDAKGNILSDPTPDEAKVWFVGHTDTVHRTHVDDQPLRIVGIGDWLMACWCGPKGVSSPEQTGIGGDDKVGVWAALEACRRESEGGPKVAAFFPVDEEIGCVGTRAFDMKLAAKAKCFLQLDRRGDSDAIEHTNGIPIWTPEFRELIQPSLKEFGFKPANGSLTDIGEFSKELRKPSMNISSGYHDAHSSKETVNWKQAFHSLAFAFSVTDAADKHTGSFGELEAPKPVTYGTHRGWRGDDSWDDSYYGGRHWKRWSGRDDAADKDKAKVGKVTTTKKPAVSVGVLAHKLETCFALTHNYPMGWVTHTVSASGVAVYFNPKDGDCYDPAVKSKIDATGHAVNHSELIAAGYECRNDDRILSLWARVANEDGTPGRQFVARRLLSQLKLESEESVVAATEQFTTAFHGLMVKPVFTPFEEGLEVADALLKTKPDGHKLSFTVVRNSPVWRGGLRNAFVSPASYSARIRELSNVELSERVVVWLEVAAPSGFVTRCIQEPLPDVQLHHTPMQIRSACIELVKKLCEGTHSKFSC